jgi:hypothetical protein
MLLFALVAMLPGISYVAGLLLAVPALEMIAGRVAPVFPRRIAIRPLPTRHLASAVRRAIPVLRYLERGAVRVLSKQTADLSGVCRDHEMRALDGG